jgi:hypothetical protein
MATLDLESASDGGLEVPPLTGTRSLLLRFVDGAGPARAVTLGAVITSRGAAALAPGKNLEAQVLFWAGEASIHATVGASFELCYGGRIVGHGIVISEPSKDGEQARQRSRNAESLAAQL